MERTCIFRSFVCALAACCLYAAPAYAGTAKDSYTLKCSMQQRKNDGSKSYYGYQGRVCTVRLSFKKTGTTTRADKVLACWLPSGNSSCTASASITQLGLGAGWDLTGTHVDPQITNNEVFYSGCAYEDSSPAIEMSALLGPCSFESCDDSVAVTLGVAHKYVCAR